MAYRNRPPLARKYRRARPPRSPRRCRCRVRKNASDDPWRIAHGDARQMLCCNEPEERRAFRPASIFRCLTVLYRYRTVRALRPASPHNRTAHARSHYAARRLRSSHPAKVTSACIAGCIHTVHGTRTDPRPYRRTPYAVRRTLPNRVGPLPLQQSLELVRADHRPALARACVCVRD